MVREGPYLSVVDQILEVLEEKLVAKEDLAAIVCEGNVKRECSGCSTDISIKAVFTSRHRIAGAPSVFFHPGQINFFSCGAKACDDQIGVLPEVSSWGVAVLAAVKMLSGTRCDNCFLLAPVKEVHRFLLYIFNHVYIS